MNAPFAGKRGESAFARLCDELRPDLYRFAFWLARDRQVAAEQEMLDVRRAILALDDDYREPLVLQVLMGCSTGEIAAQLGLSQRAVLTRLYRARQKLRRRLGVGDAEGSE